MDFKKTSPAGNDPHLSSNYDELLLQHSLLFADGLKELRDVKEQLYSAAEHFEDSYHKNDQKQMLLESLKDYISKSLIKTVDHLGSVTNKVNKFLDEHINEVSTKTKLRVVCMEQGLQTCQSYANIGSISQHLLMMQTPKYHKQYPTQGSYGITSDFQNNIPTYFQQCIKVCISEAAKAEKELVQSSNLRKGYSQQASTEFPSGLIAFSFTKAASHKKLGKRSRSISPLRFSKNNTWSTANQPTCPSFSVRLSASCVHRSISPNSSSNKQQQQPEAWRSHSLLYPQRRSTNGMEVYSKKTRSLFKVLLSIYKSKNNNI